MATPYDGGYKLKIGILRHRTSTKKLFRFDDDLRWGFTASSATIKRNLSRHLVSVKKHKRISKEFESSERPCCVKPYLPSKMKKLKLLVVLTVAVSLAYSAPAPEAKPAAGIVCDSYRNKLIKKVLFLGGSGCGSVGRAVASDTRGQWFEARHRQIFKEHLFIVNCFVLKRRK